MFWRVGRRSHHREDGHPIGPDHIGAKYDQTYLTRWLRDPSVHGPGVHMPNLRLTEAEVQALAAHLGSLR